ncbi:MAG: hypothetical protein L6V93_02880 [Clostridiales bacterium]|nr:MAG: hypothetical protein L6V93_02880 [Clostridiales bacterium]
MLERLPGDEEKFDVDALLLYDERADAKTVKKCRRHIDRKNITVSAQKGKCPKICAICRFTSSEKEDWKKIE